LILKIKKSRSGKGPALFSIREGGHGYMGLEGGWGSIFRGSGLLFFRFSSGGRLWCFIIACIVIRLFRTDQQGIRDQSCVLAQFLFNLGCNLRVVLEELAWRFRLPWPMRSPL
jgi:hypothetical protein